MDGLSLREAAAYAERTVKTVRRWVKELDLPATGAPPRIRQTDLDRFMATHDLTPGRKRSRASGDVDAESWRLFALEWNAREEAWRRAAAEDLVAALRQAMLNDVPRLIAYLSGKREQPFSSPARGPRQPRSPEAPPYSVLVVDAFERFRGSPHPNVQLSAYKMGRLRDVHRLRLAGVSYLEISERLHMAVDTAKQLHREWRDVFGPPPDRWDELAAPFKGSDSLRLEAEAWAEMGRKATRAVGPRLKPAAGLPDRRPAVDVPATTKGEGGPKRKR